MHEHFFDCLYCGEQISMLIDPSVTKQSYVEDCEVCCNPIDITATFYQGELTGFQVEKLQ